MLQETQPASLRHVSDTLAHRDRLIGHGQAEHAGSATRRLQDAEKHLHERALARAVRADQSDARSRNAARQTPECDELAVGLGEALELYERKLHGRD